MSAADRNPNLSALLAQPGHNPLNEAFMPTGFGPSYQNTSSSIEKVKDILEILLTAKSRIDPVNINVCRHTIEYSMLRGLLDNPPTALQLAKALGHQVTMEVNLKTFGYTIRFRELPS